MKIETAEENLYRFRQNIRHLPYKLSKNEENSFDIVSSLLKNENGKLKWKLAGGSGKHGWRNAL